MGFLVFPWDSSKYFDTLLCCLWSWWNRLKSSSHLSVIYDDIKIVYLIIIVETVFTGYIFLLIMFLFYISQISLQYLVCLWWLALISTLWWQATQSIVLIISSIHKMSKECWVVYSNDTVNAATRSPNVNQKYANYWDFIL